MAAHHWNISVTTVKQCPKPDCRSEDVYWTGAASGQLRGETTRLDVPARKTYVCRQCGEPFRYAGE
jgi:hypothetical protein